MFMTIHIFTFTYAYLHDGRRNLASENSKYHIGSVAAFSVESIGIKISQVISSLTSALASVAYSLKQINWGYR